MRQLIESSQDLLIECDNPACDYTIPYSEEESKFLHKYIDCPCPKCGENLLNKIDYLQHQKIMRVVKWLNKWFSWTMYLIPKYRWDNRKTISVKVHDGVMIKDVPNE